MPQGNIGLCMWYIPALLSFSCLLQLQPVLHQIQLNMLRVILIQPLNMPYYPKINFFVTTPTGDWLIFLEPPLNADNFCPYNLRPCGPFRLLKSTISSKWFKQKKYFGTFRHFWCPRGKIFLDRSKDRWPLMIFIKVHFAATGIPSCWKWPLIRWLINQRWERWEKTKKTLKKPWRAFFSEKCQQEKVLRICSFSCVQSFKEILRFISDFVTFLPTCGRYKSCTLSAASRGPPRGRELCGVPPQPPSDNDSVALGIWHTSSKGMPRHAYGRRALIFGCGSRLHKTKH